MSFRTGKAGEEAAVRQRHRHCRRQQVPLRLRRFGM